jgi:hypothetical protein
MVTSAIVYVLFSSEMRSGSFTHATDPDTAGGQFHYHLNDLLLKNKELQSLQKSAGKNPQPGTAGQIATYYLQAVDEALTEVRNWLTKHADRAWQMKTFTPNAQGIWVAEGLVPGGYEVLVRGKFSKYDADWESGVDLSPGGAISLPLTQPRFMHVLQS